MPAIAVSRHRCCNVRYCNVRLCNVRAAAAPRPVEIAEMTDTQSIRPFLELLEKRGELLRIEQPVDPRFEISALLSAAAAGPALLFDNVAGSALRVAGNLLNGRERIAAALGIAPA